MKRIVSLAVALTFVLTLVPAAVFSASALPFADVPEGSWFYGAVKTVYEKGIMKGTATDKFSPGDPMTRGQIVTILARLSGEDIAGAGASSSFADVKSGAYYADPVGWAVKNGITKGRSATEFAPDSPVLRQEFAAFFVRYMRHVKMAIPQNAVDPFPDPLPSWAKDDIETLHGTGLVMGDAKGNFNPARQMTRAEIATVTERFLSLSPADPMYAAIASLDSFKCASHNRLHYIAGSSAVEAEPCDVSLSRVGAGIRDALGLDPDVYTVKVVPQNEDLFSDFHYNFYNSLDGTLFVVRLSVKNELTGEETDPVRASILLTFDLTKQCDSFGLCPNEIPDDKMDSVWDGLDRLYVFDDDGKVYVPWNVCRTAEDLSSFFTRILFGLDDDHDLGQDNGIYRFELADGDFAKIDSLRGTGGETSVTATLFNRVLKLRSEPKEFTLVVMNRAQCVEKTERLYRQLAAQMTELEEMIGDCRRAGIPTEYETVALDVLGIFAEEHLPDYVDMDEFSRELYVRRSTEKIFDEAKASLTALLDGTKAPQNVPKFVSGGLTVDGFTIKADTVDSYGNFENRPVFFYGYGDGGEYPRTYLPYYKELGSNTFHYYRLSFADVIRAATPSDTVGVSEDGKYVVDTSGMEADLSYLSDACAGEQAVSLMLVIEAGFLPDIYPELARTAANEGGEVGINLSHPKGREVVEAFLRAVIPLVTKYPCVNNFVLTNEPAYRPYDYGDYYIPEWAEFLREKYGSLDGLSEAYGSTYGSFEEVPLVERELLKKGDVLSLDNQEFASKVHAEWHRWVAGIVHELAPGIPVSTKLKTIEYDRAMRQMGVRPEDWSDFQDLAGCDDVREDVMFYDHIAYAEDAPVVDSEAHIYHDSRDTVFTYDMDILAERIVWRGMMHHLGIGNFWSDDYWAGHADHFSFGNSAYRPLTRYVVGKVTMDLNRLSYEVDAISSAEPDVALLYSYPSRQLTAGDATEAMNGAYLGALECGKKVRIISEEQIEKLAREEINLLIVPDSVCVSDGTLDAIEAFLARGGRVAVIGRDSLTRDEVGRPRDPERSDRIKAASDVFGLRSSAEGYRLLFADYFKENDLQNVWVVDAATGEPVGCRTEWMCAEYEGRTLLTLWAMDECPSDVKIVLNGRTVASSKDLRTGEEYGETFRLVRNVALLLELDPAFTEPTPTPPVFRYEEDGFVYSVDGGEAVLVRYTGGETDVSVPAELGGMPVVSVGGFAFTACEPAVTSVTLPGSVRTLSARAFYKCPALKAVLIPGVREIGDAAFLGCPALKKIVIPEGVTKIGTRSFFRCRALEEAALPDGLEEIGNYAFKGCSSLASLDLPSTVRRIGFAAFFGCESISGTVRIPYGVTEIQGDAFRMCSGIERVEIANSVITIDERAFEDDVSLYEIILPNSLKRLGGNALTNDPLLRLDLPYGLSDLGSIHMFSPIYVPPTIYYFPNYWHFNGGVECEAGSAYERLCRENGISYTIVSPEHHIHTPGGEPTCTSHQTCTECGAVIRPSYGHVWVAEKGEDGKAVWVCSVCGEVK